MMVSSDEKHGPSSPTIHGDSSNPSSIVPMAKFQVKRRHWVGDWWWFCVDDQNNVLFYSPTSFESRYETVQEAERVQGLIGLTTEVEIIAEECNNNSILV